jgi:hypothetical protein
LTRSAGRRRRGHVGSRAGGSRKRGRAGFRLPRGCPSCPFPAGFFLLSVSRQFLRRHAVAVAVVGSSWSTGSREPGEVWFDLEPRERDAGIYSCVLVPDAVTPWPPAGTWPASCSDLRRIQRACTQQSRGATAESSEPACFFPFFSF